MSLKKVKECWKMGCREGIRNMWAERSLLYIMLSNVLLVIGKNESLVAGDKYRVSVKSLV